MATPFVASRWEKAAPPAWRPFSAPVAPRPSAPVAANRPMEPEADPPARSPAPIFVEPEPDLAAALVRAEEALADERAAHDATRAALAELRAELARVNAGAEAEAARLRAVVEGLLPLRRRLAEEVQEAAGALVLAGARKLAGEALQVQPGLLESLVNEAVAALGREGLVVRVSPADRERVAQVLDGTGAQVIGDTTIDGGCFAATPYGSVDATVQTATAALKLVVEHWQTAGWRTEDEP